MKPPLNQDSELLLPKVSSYLFIIPLSHSTPSYPSSISDLLFFTINQLHFLKFNVIVFIYIACALVWLFSFSLIILRSTVIVPSYIPSYSV